MVSGAAHFAHISGVSLEWDEPYLSDLTASDPKAIHVVIRDQAGFHLRGGDPRLPARVGIVNPAAVRFGTQRLRAVLGHRQGRHMQPGV